MPRRRIAFRIVRLIKMLLPIFLLLAVATVAIGVWLAYWIAKPPARPYIVTPEKFSHLSDRGVKVTDESWKNKDGSNARGWLLRGAPKAPAVILLHKYGADRSWLLNLGVKLNEATNFTVLWPDLRAHGENPLFKSTTFGTQETDDVMAALEYLGSLKAPQGERLVGEQIGIYGVELGGYAALRAALQDTGVRSLALDSVPASPDQLVRTVVAERTGFDSGIVFHLTRYGLRLYFFKKYQNASTCDAASQLNDRDVLLLVGAGPSLLHDSTIALSRCFPNQSKVTVESGLLISGFNLPTATGQQSEVYDRRVIEFFNKSLGMSN